MDPVKRSVRWAMGDLDWLVPKDGTASQGGVVEQVTRYALPTVRRAPAAGLQVGAGAAAAVAATFAGAALPSVLRAWRVVPVVIAVLVFAVLATSVSAAASTAVLGQLLVTGFLVNRFGELSWHGAPDVGRMVLVGGAAAAG